MNRLGLLAVLLIASIPAIAAKGILDFKGFPLGGRVEAFKQKFPSFQCKTTEDHQIACDSYRETYAGLDADIILVSFEEGKLRRFQIDGTGAEKKALVLAAMKEKYGAPSSEEKHSTNWELSNGRCSLVSGTPPAFQVICVSATNTPQRFNPGKGDI